MACCLKGHGPTLDLRPPAWLLEVSQELSVLTEGTGGESNFEHGLSFALPKDGRKKSRTDDCLPSRDELCTCFGVPKRLSGNFFFDRNDGACNGSILTFLKLVASNSMTSSSLLDTASVFAAAEDISSKVACDIPVPMLSSVQQS